MTANKDEWFLNDRWDDAEQLIFFPKLKRARYKKGFIIRAKGSTLLFSGDLEKVRAALTIFQIGIDECQDSDLLSSFYLQSARCHIKLSNKNEALDMFRKTLEVQQDETKFVRVTNAWSDYGSYVVRENETDRYDEILSAIENAKTFLVKELFLKHALKAIIFSRQNKIMEANHEKSEADMYLNLEESEFPNRPKLGLVDREELHEIIAMLNSIT